MAADIRALELEFAKSPTLDACIPLCEAYLGNKRFMEAMVVCKKGIKSAPTDPRGRVMLARVYLDQGKLPKAEQELSSTLQDFPGNPLAFELLGQVMVQQGRAPEAIGYLQQALAADPSLVIARNLLQQLGAPAPAPAQPQAAPAPGAPGAQPPAMPQQPPQGFGQQQPPQGFGQQQPPQGFGQQQPPQGFGQPGFTPPQGTPQLGGFGQGGQPQFPQAQPGQGFPPAQGFQQPGQPAQPGQVPAAPQAGGFGQQPPATPPGQQPSPFATPAPWGAPGQPADGQQQPPGFVDPAAPAQGHEAPKLEHVSDFFAEETLGFSNDASHIETAGPGRLTILGFVPKNTGSIKTTIFVALGLIAVVGAFVAYQYYNSKNTLLINKKYGELRIAMDEDKFPRYRDALRLGDEILQIDDDHNQTLAAMAYAQGVLGSEHAEDAALDRARDYLKQAEDSSDTPTEYRVAARLLLATEDEKYDEGITYLQEIYKSGGSGALIELEGLRLLHAAKPNDKETQKQLARLKQTLVSQPRAFAYLGWFYYDEEDWQQADRYFAETLKNSKDHPVALLGQALADLERGIGIKERQKEIGENIKKVFSLPADELSQPVLALAHFTRAQLEAWQEKNDEAEADYEKAFELDPGNATFHYRRGVAQLKYRNLEGAIASLREAAKIEPNHAGYYKALGEAQTKAKDFKAAHGSLERAGELASGDPEVTLLKGDLLVAEKKWDDAIAMYEKVPKDAPARIWTYAQIGHSTALRESGAKAKAVKFMEDVLGNAPGSIGPDMQAPLWCELGLDNEAVRDKEKAMQAYTIGIEQFRYYPMCHLYSCRLLGRDGKEACKLYLALAPRGEFREEAERRAR